MVRTKKESISGHSSLVQSPSSRLIQTHDTVADTLNCFKAVGPTPSLPVR